jgi:hypothetical protein
MWQPWSFSYRYFVNSSTWKDEYTLKKNTYDSFTHRSRGSALRLCRKKQPAGLKRESANASMPKGSTNSLQIL